MKQRNYPTIKYIALIVLALLSLGYGVANILVIYKMTLQESQLISYIDCTILVFVFISASNNIIKSLLCEIEVTDDGINQYLKGKIRRSIKWNEIIEIDTGTVITPFGKRKRIYFSKEKLSQDEKENLGLANKKCIYFSFIKKEIAKKITKYTNYDLSNWIK